MPRRLVRYSIGMTFEQAMRDGDLDQARVILDELADLPDTGGLWLPECYGDLAQSYDRRGRHDDAIAAQERAIALGCGGRPDPRSDIAEFHLRARRAQQAAAIWVELKAENPDDVWLYNAQYRGLDVGAASGLVSLVIVPGHRQSERDRETHGAS